MKNAVFATILTLCATVTGFAQDHTIDGEAVPEEHMASVEAWCQELLALQGATGTQEPETAVDETTADKTVPTNTGDDPATKDDFDVKAITLDQCVEGGFVEGTNTAQ